MRAEFRLPAVSLLIALLLSCERTPQDTGPFNQPLGSARPVAPTPAPVIDAGILQDQSAYQPARYGAVELGAAAATVTGGEEEEAIRGRVREILQAVVARNVDAIFDAFVQEQIAAVLPLKSSVIETVEKFEALQRQMSQIGGPAQPDQARNAALQAIGNKLMDALTGALAVEVLSAQQAAVRIDSARLAESLTALLPEMQAALQELAAASGDESAAMAMPPLTPERIAGAAQMLEGHSLPMSRVEDAWRIALPWALSEAHAEIGKDALALLNDYLDKVMEQLQTVEAPDPSAIRNIFTQVGLELMPRALELGTKVQALMQESAPPGGAEPAEPQAGDEQPGAEREPGAEDEEEPAPPRGGRTPRVP